jgi:DNA-binding HxlR family transcriptional regulator
MLTQTLRHLERDGMVSRTLHAQVPPRADYQLTELGASALVPVSALGEWARSYQARVLGNRSRPDTDAPEPAP